MPLSAVLVVHAILAKWNIARLSAAAIFPVSLAPDVPMDETYRGRVPFLLPDPVRVTVLLLPAASLVGMRRVS